MLAFNMAKTKYIPHAMEKGIVWAIPVGLTLAIGAIVLLLIFIRANRFRFYTIGAFLLPL